MGIFTWSTLPETNSSPLKMDGWKTILSFWKTLFSGAFAVSFREGKSWQLKGQQKPIPPMPPFR